MTHALLWNHATNTMRVQTVEWLLSHAREAYTGNRPMGWVPIAIGGEDAMRAAAQCCEPTLTKREPGQPDLLRLLDDPKPIAPAHFARAQVATEAAR
jgi:hypothetical protein